MKKLLIPLFLSLSATLAAPAFAATQEEVRGLINKATTTREAAAAAGFEWTGTADLITRAQTALETDNIAAAEALARQALKQAQNAVAQAEYADAHWRETKPD